VYDLLKESEVLKETFKIVFLVLSWQHQESNERKGFSGIELHVSLCLYQDSYPLISLYSTK
jgi:hypothetical protein